MEIKHCLGCRWLQVKNCNDSVEYFCRYIAHNIRIDLNIDMIDECDCKEVVYMLAENLGPDSIEKWCEELDSKPRCELNENQKYIARICRMNRELLKKRWEAELHFNPNHTGRIIMDLIKERHTYTIDYGCALFLSRLIYVPATAFIYTTFIQYKCWQHGIKEVDFRTLNSVILPEGVFDKDTLDEMWRKQLYISEDSPDNIRKMLANPEFMQSIIDIKEI